MLGCMAGAILNGFDFSDHGFTFEKSDLLGDNGIHMVKWSKRSLTPNWTEKYRFNGERDGTLCNRKSRSC